MVKKVACFVLPQLQKRCEAASGCASKLSEQVCVLVLPAQPATLGGCCAPSVSAVAFVRAFVSCFLGAHGTFLPYRISLPCEEQEKTAGSASVQHLEGVREHCWARPAGVSAGSSQGGLLGRASMSGARGSRARVMSIGGGKENHAIASVAEELGLLWDVSNQRSWSRVSWESWGLLQATGDWSVRAVAGADPCL